MFRCASPAALQERFDKELQRHVVAQGNHSGTTETDGPASANGVSDVTGKGEETAAAGTNERLEQVNVHAPVAVTGSDAAGLAQLHR